MDIVPERVTTTTVPERVILKTVPERITLEVVPECVAVTTVPERVTTTIVPECVAIRANNVIVTFIAKDVFLWIIFDGHIIVTSAKVIHLHFARQSAFFIDCRN